MKISTVYKISSRYFLKKKRFRFQVTAVYFILFFLLFFSVTFGASFYTTLKKIFSSADTKFITVVPKDMDISIFKFSTPSFLGKGELKENDLLSINRLSGITEISPTYSLNSPSQLSGGMFEMSYGTDLAIFGEEKPFEKIKYNSKNIKIIPAVVSSRLLDIYNLSFAPANNLPKLSEKIIIGRRFNVSIGQNSFSSTDKKYRFKVKIVGLSDKVGMLGITVPETILKKLAAKINSDIKISSIRVETENAADLISVAENLIESGYKLRENGNKLFEKVNKYITGLKMIINLPIAFVLFIIILFIKNQLKYMLAVLRKEMGIQLTFGIYCNDLIKIWLFQYGKLMILASFFGFTSGLLLIKLFIFLQDGYYFQNIIAVNYDGFKFFIYTTVIIFFSLFYLYYNLRKFFKENTIVNLIS